MTSTCTRHPDREASFYCQKDGTYLCEECACCWSPRIYCKFRTACVIHALTKEGALKPCPEDRLPCQE
ncbi:MAG: hypothetical protein LDL33_00540 [Desulfomonile sp.]|nr:hypothetical protein [Desulfomonile sp.]